jgi:hypothetical protein
MRSRSTAVVWLQGPEPQAAAVRLTSVLEAICCRTGRSWRAEEVEVV